MSTQTWEGVGRVRMHQALQSTAARVASPASAFMVELPLIYLKNQTTPLYHKGTPENQ